jgi:hypothetical protein
MNRLVSKFIVVRLKMLQALAFFAAGWFACVAWMLVIRFAPQIAIDMVMKAKGLQ